MAVFRVEKNRDYTVMSNHHLKDKNLSLKSKGLLSMMLSLPDEWNYTTRGLAAICKEGVDSIGAALREMENAGYIVRNQVRDAKGKIADTEYVIYERPQKLDTGKPDTAYPCTGFPYMDKPDTAAPDMDKPDTENPAQLNTYRQSTNLSNTDLSINPSINQSIPLTGSSTMDEYRDLVRDNISYSTLCYQYGRERMDEVVELILETLYSQRQRIRIGQEEYVAEVVKSRLLKINQFHLEYVFSCMDNNKTKVRNIKGYLLATLFNAPVTINHYYAAEVSHDACQAGDNDIGRRGGTRRANDTWLDFNSG